MAQSKVEVVGVVPGLFRRSASLLLLALLLPASLLAAAACASPTPDPQDTSSQEPTSEVGDDGQRDEAAEDLDVGPVVDPVRHPFGSRSIYFVMPDRFANGDPTNDTGGVEGGPLETGFLPTNKAYHHGGDLAGLTEQIPYIAGMGFSAIWITPPFTNRYIQGDGTIEGSSSSYHGYWQINWDQIDPHLGTEQEMQDFVAAAQAMEIAVIFDAVVNHTGDVIDYAEDSNVYRSTSSAPYVDADGKSFDAADLADGAIPVPSLATERSFPYTPVFNDPADETAKSPGWLNDPLLYHNRGDSTFNGESNLYGDFFGLDDLFTEHPEVVSGMIDLYGDVVERYGIDGFRVDTMKHVNMEFWRQWSPAVLQRAAEAGRPDFFFFGEVASTDPILASSFTNAGVPSTLDFGLDTALQTYVNGGLGASVVADAFDNDDWYTDADNNASMQVNFLGNHDAGRFGAAVARSRPGATDEELLRRMKLGFDLLFTSRGVPVVYYGDEQGFTGSGGDQLARQSMFPSVTPDYLDDEQIGTDTTPAEDNFDVDHPLYKHIAELNRLRTDHPALTVGAQMTRHAEGPVLAFSRIDRSERIEYLIVTNANGSLTVPARFDALSRSTRFTSVYGVELSVTADAEGEILVEMPPLSTVVLRADQPLATPNETGQVAVVRPEPGQVIPTPRYRLQAEVGEDVVYGEVTFAVTVDGKAPVVVGVDDAPPYRVYWDTTGVPDGATVEVLATLADGSGRLMADRVATVMGARPETGR